MLSKFSRPHQLLLGEKQFGVKAEEMKSILNEYLVPVESVTKNSLPELFKLYDCHPTLRVGFEVIS